MENEYNLICDEKLLQRIRTNMKGFSRRTHQGKDLKRAAVAITIIDAAQGSGLFGTRSGDSHSREAAIILTRRSLRLKNHAGQWALPGGSLDAGESPEDTALRELDEEVGLKLDQERVIGRLDDFTTRSGFTITPVVVWGGPGLKLEPNPAEVASIHRIPVVEFMRKDAPHLEEMPGSRHPVLRMPVGNSWIAAPTAALLYQFREVAILGRGTRVAHYEQPFFAWR
jgi:8-oxo-dGTP pyrophosphatase MutT (NUDIX family)